MIAEQIKKEMAGGSAIRQMFEEGNRLKRLYGEEAVFDFSLGNPDLPAPPAVEAAFRQALTEGGPKKHGYMSNAGFAATRQAVAGREQARCHAPVTANGVIMTVGAAGALNIIFKSLLNPGDEVLVFAPYFSEYRSYVANAGGVLKVLPTDPTDFSPDPEVLRAAITLQTKVLLLNSPNNPSGRLYNKSLLKALADCLKEVEQTVYIVSDEPYVELVYDGLKAPSILDIYPHSLVAYSWSKSLSLAGERIGYVCLSEDCSDYDDLVNALIYCNRTLGFVNAPALAQRVLAKVASASVDVSVYQRRRDRLFQILQAAGFSCRLPEGAFYLFPVSPEADDRAFCATCAAAKLLCVPGSSFGMPGHFRLSFCVGDDVIERSADVFLKLGQHYGLC